MIKHEQCYSPCSNSIYRSTKLMTFDNPRWSGALMAAGTATATESTKAICKIIMHICICI